MNDKDGYIVFDLAGDDHFFEDGIKAECPPGTYAYSIAKHLWFRKEVRRFGWVLPPLEEVPKRYRATVLILA